MPALTGFAPPDKTAQTAGDYLASSSNRPSYGIGGSSSGYPSPTPTSISAAAAPPPPSGWSGSNSAWDAIYASLTPDQLAQWNQIKSTQQGATKASMANSQNNADLGKAVSGYGAGQVGNPFTSNSAAASGVGGQLYSLLTPQQQQMWNNAMFQQTGGSWLNQVSPILALAGAAIGGEALFGAGAAGSGGVAASTAAADTLPVTADSLAYSTGNLVASTAAPGAVTDIGATLGTGAGAAGGVGTLADITVTAPAAAASGLGTAAEIGGAAAGIGGAIDLTGASGSTMPTPNYGWKQYLPKNMITEQLMANGVNPTVASIAGGAGQGALTSGILGGNPVTGALSGGVGSGVGSALTDAGLPSGISNTIGSTVGKAAAMADTSTGTNPSTAPSGLSALGNNIMGSLSDIPVGSAVTAGLGLYNANQANKANQNLINSLTNATQPWTAAGQNALSNYQTLTPQETAALQSGVSAGTSQVQGAQPLIGLGQQQLNIGGSGNLPPDLQAQLNNQVAAAKAQLAQTYSPDSTTYQQLSAQIDQQAMITKQQMLANYQTSGQSTYAAGETQQTAGQNEIAGAYAAAQVDINQNLSNAISMATTGLGPLAQAVELALKNNSQAQTTMNDLMKSIGSASSGTPTGQTIGGLFKGVFGGGAPSANMTNFLNQGTPSNVMPDGTALGITPTIDAAAPTVGNIDLSNLTPDLSNVSMPDISW